MCHIVRRRYSPRKLERQSLMSRTRTTPLRVGKKGAETSAAQIDSSHKLHTLSSLGPLCVPAPYGVFLPDQKHLGSGKCSEQVAFPNPSAINKVSCLTQRPEFCSGARRRSRDISGLQST